jgi:hypothetical protein
MNKKWIARFSALTLVALAGGALATTTLAGPPVCPQIWAPVICDNGKVYANQCYADKAHAKNCVPYPGGI